MYTLVFIAPAIATVVSLAFYYLARPKDFGAIALQLAEEETRSEIENEAWSRALIHAQCNRTIRGY